MVYNRRLRLLCLQLVLEPTLISSLSGLLGKHGTLDTQICHNLVLFSTPVAVCEVTLPKFFDPILEKVKGYDNLPPLRYELSC